MISREQGIENMLKGAAMRSARAAERRNRKEWEMDCQCAFTFTMVAWRESGIQIPDEWWAQAFPSDSGKCTQESWDGLVGAYEGLHHD